MGFFSELIKTVVAPIAAGFLGTTLAQPAAPVMALAKPTGLAAGVVGGRPVLPTQVGVVKEIFQATGGPTGRRRKRTTVETFDPVSGIVTARVTFSGGVAVRASDVAAFKRVFRQVTKLSAKLPRKIIKPSDVKLLTDRVVKNALERAGDVPDCPK